MLIRNSSSHPVSFILLGIPRIENSQFGCFPSCAMLRFSHNITLLLPNPTDPTFAWAHVLLFWPCWLPLTWSSPRPHNLKCWPYSGFTIMRLNIMPASSSCSSSTLFFSGVRIAHGYGPWPIWWLFTSHCITLASWPLAVVGKLGAGVMMRGLLWVSPFCFMVSRMPFCPSRIILNIMWAHGCAEVGVRWH